MFTSLKIVFAKLLAIPLVAILTLAGHPIVQPDSYAQVPVTDNSSQTLSAPFNPTAGGTYYLQGGISTSASTFYLSSFLEPISNIPYTMSYLNSSIEYGVIDPLTPNRSELISFTGITQNSNGSATLTGVIRGLSRSYPFTASTSLALTHAAQAQFIMSATPQLFSQYGNKSLNEVITGEWSGPTPLANADLATKSYVDTHVNGGPVSNNQLIVAGTAGETVSTGQVLYFQQSAGQWFKAATTIKEASTTILSIAQGAGTVGNLITGGVLLSGVDSNQSGLTSGRNYFLSSTAGTINTSTTTRIVGKAQSSTQLYFNTSMLADGLLTTNNTFTNQNSFSTSTLVVGTATSSYTMIGAFPAYNIGKNIQVITTTGTSTFTVPSGVQKLYVRVVGAGGGGGASAASTAIGGGACGGAYAEGFVDVSATTSITVFVGTGGTGGTAGNTGNAGTWSTFGANGFYMLALGGGPGGGSSSGSNSGCIGGSTASGGNINITGASGTGGFSVAGITISSTATPGGLAGYGAGSYGTGGKGAINTTADSGNQGIIIIIW